MCENSHVVKFLCKNILIVLTLTSVGFLGSASTNASLSCTYVEKQAKSVFDKKWTEMQTKEPLKEFAKRINKSMTIVFANQRCFSKKDITKMKNAIRDIQKQCVEARKDELTGSFVKDLCEAFSGVYKYAK